MEILAIAIRQNKNIRGIRIGDTEFKISQLADDTTCFLNDEESGFEVLNIMQSFHSLSGLKINLNKTEAIWIGSKRNHKPGTLPVKWSRGDFFTLGIWFNSEDENNVINKNLKTKLEDLKVTLNLWKMRNLSLLGKILVTKSLALSKLVYVASVIPIPDNIINLVQKEINRFIWNSEIPKIKYTISCQRFGDGGFKFPNFEIQVKSLQLNWIKRFFSANEAKWKKLINALKFTETLSFTLL